MKTILLLLFVSLCTVCCAEESPGKDKLAQELVKIYGVDETVSKAKQIAETQARAATDRMITQLRAGMANLDPKTWDKMAVAADKMIATVGESWKTEEAIKVWQTEFCADLSEEELKQIIAASETPLGQKQIAAAKRASAGFQQFYVKRIKEASEEAMKQYVIDLQHIESEAASESK